jgi:hypothetical protein
MNNVCTNANMPCTICKESGHNKTTCKADKPKDTKPKAIKETNTTETPDTYDAETLKECYELHKNYVKGRIAIRTRTKLPIRLPNMPEDISENIVKFILHNHPDKYQDKTSRWTKSLDKKNAKATSGDLFSEKEGTQECKCFTSDGPPSFGPNEKWDVIYFLDARAWLEDKFVLWRIPLTNTSPEWKAIKMNKNQTNEEQSAQGRRPRITWDSLYPQIQTHCAKIFEGTFEQIFNQKKTAEAPVA